MSILELMTQYNIELTKQGDLYIGYCVFHDDKNRPNFTVYVKTNSYFCYTCNRGGDAIDFYARMENLSRESATERLTSNLQDLISRITRVEQPLSYNESVNLQLSKQFRDFLYTSPDLLHAVKDVMREVDSLLCREVTQAQAVELINNVTTKLAHLGDSDDKDSINI